MSRRRDLGVVVGAIFVSAAGDWIALTALAVFVQETHDSGLAVAGLFIALWSPLVVFAGPAGLLVDRASPKSVLVVASLAQAAAALALGFTSMLPLLLVLTALLGVANAVSQPAEFALIPRVVDEGGLATANAHVETARFLGFALGPLAGGVLAAAGGMRLALIVDAATFVLVALAAAGLRCQVEACTVPAPAEGIGHAREGVAFLLRDEVLRIVMLVAFASLLFMTASGPAEVFFAKEVLDVGSIGFGALWTAWFAGMAVGGLTLAGRVRGPALAGAALWAIVVQSLGVAAPTLWLVFAFALGSAVVGGIAHGTKNVLVRTLMHQRVPSRLHGRAFAAYNGLRNGAEMVALVLGGVLVAAIGARWTLLVAGGAPMAVGLAGVVLYRRTRPRDILETAPEVV